MRFLSKDPVTGIERWMSYDYETDTVTEFATADISHEVEASKHFAKDDDYWKQGVKNEFAHYGHIPAIVLEKWAAEGVDINDMQSLFRMINKPEYAYLKTTTKYHAG